MENIIQFPTKDVRDWAFLERSMKESLSRKRVSLAAQTRLLEQMKSFYEIVDPQINFSLDVSLTGSDKIVREACLDISTKISASLNKQLQAFTNRLMIDRFNREVEVCRELGLLG